MWFVTRHGQDELDYGHLVLLRQGPRVSRATWADGEDIEEPYKPLCQVLAAAGVAAPAVGDELERADGATWAEVELMWEEAQVAVMDASKRAQARGEPAEGWRVFDREQLDDPAPLIEALLGSGDEHAE